MGNVDGSAASQHASVLVLRLLHPRAGAERRHRPGGWSPIDDHSAHPWVPGPVDGDTNQTWRSSSVVRKQSVLYQTVK